MNEQGRLKMALEKFVQQTVPGIDYLAQYPGTIVAQNGQLFDFQPDSAAVPALQGLAFYAGLPGITFTVDPTQSPRAVLFFQDGSPAAPALAFWGNPGLVSLAIGGSGPAAARVGDGVTIALSDLQQFVFTAPAGGGPCVITGAIVGAPATQISSGSTITEIA